MSTQDGFLTTIGAELSLAKLVKPPPSNSFAIQAGLHIAFSTMIIVASWTIIARFRRDKTLIWTKCDETGLVTTNTASIVQVSFGVYSILNIVVLVGYLRTRYVSTSNLTLQLVSPLLTFVAFLALAHSTVTSLFFNPLLAPFPSPPPRPASQLDPFGIGQVRRRRRLHAKSRRINRLSLLAFAALVVPPIVVTVEFVKAWKALIQSADEGGRYVEGVGQKNARLSSLVLGGFERRNRQVVDDLEATARVWSVTWIAMLALALVICLVPLVYLLSVLRRRRSALRQAVALLQTNRHLSRIPFKQNEANSFALDRKAAIEDRLSKTEFAIKKNSLWSVVAIGLSIAYLVLLAWVVKSFDVSASTLFLLTTWSNWISGPMLFVVSLAFAYSTVISRAPAATPTTSRSCQISPPRLDLALSSYPFSNLSPTLDSLSFHSNSTMPSPAPFLSTHSVSSPSAVGTHRPFASYPPLPTSTRLWQTPSVPASTLERQASQSTTRSIIRKVVPQEEDMSASERASDCGSVFVEELKDAN
ncbi:hypothetical protein JCM10212_002746 [Sporobolomyces blumeae]